MPTLADKRNCTGCTACYSVCPKDSISMEPDILGFKYPKIDISKCIECKLCEKVCPIIQTNSFCNQCDQLYYAGQIKDTSKLMESQSGGVFYVISLFVISNGGVVYGAGFDKDLNVRHHRIDRVENINKLTKSKYVQSELGDCFENVKEDLRNNKVVLFSGTPCQIAGLKRTISKSLINKLLTIDLVCHGVPGPYVFKDYINYVERKYSKKVKDFIFRDKKKFGWKTAFETVVFYDGTEVSLYNYNYLFLEDLINRPACSKCKFCSLSRVGDITIADCWGWEKLGYDVIDEEKGVSLIIVNTILGREILAQIKNRLILLEVPIEPLMQNNLYKPSERPQCADKLYKDYYIGGYELIFKKYGNTRMNLLIRRIRNLTKTILNRIKICFR